MSEQTLLRRIPQLEAEGLITPEQSERLRVRYGDSDAVRNDRTLLLFSILGGVLASLGVVLLTFYYWYDFPKWLRTFIAVVPMLIGQWLCWTALKKKNGATRWTEGSAIGLAFAVATAIIVLSSIYHIRGDLSNFLLTWSVLMLGIIYAMRSVTTAMVYVLVISLYAFGIRWEDLLELRFGKTHDLPLYYLPLLGALIPFFISYSREKGHSLGFFWLCIFSATSISFANVLFYNDFGLWNMIGPLGLMCTFTLIPHLVHSPELRTGPFTFIGEWNLISILLLFSWRDVWRGLQHADTGRTDPYPLLFLVFLAFAAYIASMFKRKPFERTLFPEVALMFSVVLWMGYHYPTIGTVLVNLGLIMIGTATVMQGIQRGNNGRIHLGMFLLIATVGMRLFDKDLTLFTRSMLFLVFGAIFLSTYFWWRNNRKPAAPHA